MAEEAGEAVGGSGRLGETGKGWRRLGRLGRLWEDGPLKL